MLLILAVLAATISFTCSAFFFYTFLHTGLLHATLTAMIFCLVAMHCCPGLLYAVRSLVYVDYSIVYIWYRTYRIHEYRKYSLYFLYSCILIFTTLCWHLICYICLPSILMCTFYFLLLRYSQLFMKHMLYLASCSVLYLALPGSPYSCIQASCFT